MASQAQNSTKVHIKQYSENPESFDPDVRKENGMVRKSRYR